jgi:hypothetical protein
MATSPPFHHFVIARNGTIIKSLLQKKQAFKRQGRLLKEELATTPLSWGARGHVLAPRYPAEAGGMIGGSESDAVPSKTICGGSHAAAAGTSSTASRKGRHPLGVGAQRFG